MHAILYDCRDAGRGCTLRIFDGERMTVQAWLHGTDPIHLANTIAASFTAGLRVVGPPTRQTRPTPALTLDTPAPYTVASQPRKPKPQPTLF